MTPQKIWTQLDLRCSASVGVRSGQKLLCDVKQRIGYKTCILRVLLRNIRCPTSTQHRACRWRYLITNNDPDIIERMMFCVAAKAWRYQVSEEQTLYILQHHALRLVPPPAATPTVCIIWVLESRAWVYILPRNPYNA